MNVGLRVRWVVEVYAPWVLTKLILNVIDFIKLILK